MRSVVIGSAIAWVLFNAPAHANVVFFDDFEGDALLPHWNQPPPSYWEYNVSNSMLNVTGLFNPSHPKSPSNFTSITAPFSPQSDFQVDAWMGWEAGSQPHRLVLQVLGPFGGGNPVVAQFGYRNEASWGPIPLIFAGASGQSVSVPAPGPGIHHFTIIRTGTQVNFFLNGSSFASFSGTSGITAAHVGFFFLGPYPGELGAFHVDRVQVVPSPSAILLLGAAALISRNRRHR